MKTPKTYQLIATLSKKNIALLKKQLNTLSNELFSICLKQFKQQKFEQEQIFKAFYKKKYSTEENYLLRNDLRKLNQAIEQFIIETEWQKKAKTDFYLKKKLYLNYLLEQNALELLSKELQRIFIQINKKEDYEVFYDFFVLWTKLQNKQFAYDSIFFTEAKAFYDQAILHWFKEVSLKTKQVEIFKRFIERTHIQINPAMRFSEPIESISFKNIESQLEHFFYLKEQSFRTFGEEKINILLQALAIIPNLKSTFINLNEAHYFVLQSLSVEYFIAENYSKASEYLSQIMSFYKKINTEYFIRSLFNYINVEIRLKNYQKVIDLYQQFQAEIKASNIYEYYACIIPMCYILLNDVQQAEENLLIVSSSVSLKNNIYSRLNLSIIHFLNNEIDLCLNELENILQSIRYHSDVDKEELGLNFIKGLRLYIQAHQAKHSPKDKQKLLQKVKITITELKLKTKGHHNSNNSLHSVWLLSVIE